MCELTLFPWYFFRFTLQVPFLSDLQCSRLYLSLSSMFLAFKAIYTLLKRMQSGFYHYAICIVFQSNLSLSWGRRVVRQGDLRHHNWIMLIVALIDGVKCCTFPRFSSQQRHISQHTDCTTGVFQSDLQSVRIAPWCMFNWKMSNELQGQAESLKPSLPTMLDIRTTPRFILCKILS